MPGPATIFSIGAVGAGAAAVYANRRYSQSSASSNDDSVITPIQLARRRSSTVQPDHDWVKRKQPEYIWRRDNGVSFSHNSKPKFPKGQNTTTEQTSK